MSGKVRSAEIQVFSSERRIKGVMRGFTAVIERCPDTGLYVGYVPGFPGAHSQAKALDELHNNFREVIAMLLEGGEPRLEAAPTTEIAPTAKCF